MTSLEAVASYLPPDSTPIGPYLEELGAEREEIKLFRRFHGFSRIRRDAQATLADLMVAAAGGLDELRGREHRVRYLVQARTIQLAAPYPDNPLHEVRRALGLEHALAFSISQHACASALLAVDLCGRLLAADGDPEALALVITGEKTFTRVAQFIDSAVMGEGTAAVLVRPGGDRDRVLGYATRTDGEFHTAPYLTPQLLTKFNDISPNVMAEVITAALAQAGLEPSDVALVLPHNVNRLGWLRLARTLDIPSSRIVLDNLPALGHCFGADSFINYRTARELGRLRPGDYYVMTAIGVGATWAAMVFQH